MEQSGAEITKRDRAKEHSKAQLTVRVEPFLKEYDALGHHGQAAKNLSHRVPHFLAFLDENQTPESEISLQTAYDYQGYLIDRGRRDGKPYKSSTVRSYIKAAAAYTRWLADTGCLMTNPFTVMRKVPEGESLPKDLPKEADLGRYLQHLADFNSPATFKNRLRRYRTHVAAEVLYASGLRISELADLHLEDIDLPGGRIFVARGKGGKSRYVFLTEYSVRILDIYIRTLRPLIIRYYPSVDQNRLFLSSPETLGHTLNKDLRSAGADTNDTGSITAHRMRHCLGYHLLRAGCPLRYIQQILGHAHIKTSEIYTKVDGDKLGEMLSSCHPRGHRPKGYQPEERRPGASA